MGGHSPLEQEDDGGSAGDGLPTWEGCPSHHDPLVFRILAVAYPELDGRLRASQQTHGASSGGGAVATEHNRAASHMALEGETTDSEFTSGTEGEWSSTAGTGGDTSDTDLSSDGSSLVVAATSVPPASTATKASPRGPGGSVESAVTPSKVGKGHKKPGKSGKSSAAEKTAIIPDAQEPTSSTSPAAQDRTASTSPPAQEATASTSPAAQEATVSTSPAAQEATANSSTAEQGTAVSSTAGP
ncbi:hypothetical protein NDU88_007281 [Pleurodeles waltl]|uniref:Uncharacterized protein n=1 Tax=Pleurodeles waltl TaxID=8319 RepID=A0AAV7PM35_PLEWA|nr:hypothetical protein NDU88_007281 [Pleurodeles waltl]